MHNLSKRILSMLMTLVLILSLVPAAALADDSINPVTRWNVTLKDNISANFHLTLDDPANTVVNITVAGNVTAIRASDAAESNGCRVFTVELAAAQMTDAINIEVVVNGVSVYSKAYSIKQYADKILTGDYDEEVKKMVLSMLCYGTAAQTYFKYNLGNLANAGCEELTPVTVPASESEVGAYFKTGSVSGISYYGATLTFVSRIAVRFYYTVDEGSSISDYTFKAGDTVYTPVAVGDYYYVEISDIYPQNLKNQYTVTVSKSSETLSVTYGPLNYVVRQNNNASSSETLKALVQMLYTYHKVSVEYVEYLAALEALIPTEGNIAALNIYYISDSTPMSFITKQAYPAGTTITFKAYQPYISDADNRWWGIGTTADANGGSIYTCAKAGNNMYRAGNNNRWAEYSYTLPADSKDSYIFIAGAKNIAWKDYPLLIDDVVITVPGEAPVSDGFEYGLTAGLFNLNTPTAVELQHLSTATAQEALDEIKAQYGDTIAVGTELPSTWWVKGNEFTVTWTASGAASVSDGKLIVVAQNETAAYTLTATVSNGNDTASHNWSGSVSARTGNVAALTINKLNENAPMSFITKEAYAGGSTVTFDAYVPSGASWWAVCWTTDPSNTDLYKWTGGEAYGKSMASVTDQWAEYSVTLPSGSNSYYIYFVGEKGQWKDAEGNALALLIDNVTITSGSTSVTDGFERGLTGGLFNVNSADTAELLNLDPVTVTAQEALDDLKAHYGNAIASGTELVSAWTLEGVEFAVNWEVTEGSSVASVSGGKLILTPPSNAAANYLLKATVSKDEDTASYSWNGTVNARTGNVAALTIDQLNENAPMSFITKEAYAGGSTVSFDAYVPSGASWWAVCWTTDPSNTDLYKWTGGEAYGKTMTSTKDQWAEYSVTLPDDSNRYYIYIVGAKGEWKDAEGNALQLLIDNVTITSGSTSVTDDFEDTSLFTFNNGAALQTIEHEEVTPRAGNYAAIYIDNLTGNAPMSFITKEAYPGGSTVTFDAYVPSGTGWWAVCWTTDPNDTDLYKWTGGAAYGKSMSSTEDAWAEYSVTLPDDSNSYYIYIVGAKGEWKGNALLIDDVTITPAGGTAITEDFEKGLDDCLFNVVKTHGANTVVEWKREEL